MITKEQRKRLEYLMHQVREAREQNNRFYNGWSNYTEEQVQAASVKARTELNDFLDEITEQ